MSTRERIHFKCPVETCGVEHDRGYIDGVDTFRCLRCGYVGHGFHPEQAHEQTLHNCANQAKRLAEIAEVARQENIALLAAETRARVAEERIKALEWQVANWERKEVSRAICCVANEQRAEAAEKRVGELEAELAGNQNALVQCQNELGEIREAGSKVLDFFGDDYAVRLSPLRIAVYGEPQDPEIQD